MRFVWKSGIAFVLVFANFTAASLAGTISERFFFPHYADGAGISMQISITNSSSTGAFAALHVFDGRGEPQTLPGIGSDVDMALAAHETVVLTSLGTSDPVRTGYIVVEGDSDEVSGLAIFRLADGSEASVLPSILGDRFSMFVERRTGLDSGIALFRSDPNRAVAARLFNEAGVMMFERLFPIDSELQAARSLSEIFSPLGSDFRGSLELVCSDDEDCRFTPVGLRFGSVLSTVAVTDLTEREVVPPGEPPISEGLAAIRRLVDPSGRWFFEFVIGSSTFDDEYAFFQALELPNPTPSQLPFQALGVDVLFDPVLATYVVDEGEYLLLDPSFIFDNVYIFTFDNEDTVRGCYHMLDHDTNNLGTCRTMEGQRFDFLDAATQTVDSKSKAREELLREAFEREKFTAPSPDLAKAIAGLRKRLENSAGSQHPGKR
ncbi:MAG TPA: hypothetical protein VLV83_19025 [Acidobacteriota bacterium]|nr:hypothetical protein [Acidobacteriota bacterium]